MNKKELVDKYFQLRRLNTDIYADTYRWGMDDFLYIPFNINDIKLRWKKYLEINKNTKIDFYLHIPFCYTLCKYCDYYKTLLKPNLKEKYLDYIYWYLDEFQEVFKEIEFNSIYIWWWTPSILQANEIDKLLNNIFTKFKFSVIWEKTFEINPVNISIEKLEVLKKYPINRISMWIQSTDPDVLEKSNRWYQRESTVEKTLELLKRYWYEDINWDVIMWLKEDTLESIEKTVLSMKEWWFASVCLYRLLPTEEYLEEHFNWNLEHFNKEVLPRISIYHDYFIWNKELWKFIWNKNDWYRWDLFFKEIKKEKYDDFSTNSLFWVGASSRSHIFWDIYYKFLDELDFPKALERNIFLWKNISLDDEKDCYKIVNITHNSFINIEEYKKHFNEDFFIKNKEIISDFDKKWYFSILWDNTLKFDIDLKNKIYSSLFLLSDKNLYDKITFLSINNNLTKIKFINNLELSILIEKNNKNLEIIIWNNFSVNKLNIDLFKNIIIIIEILRLEFEKSYILEDFEIIKRKFLNVLMLKCKKIIKSVKYEL